MGVGVLIVFISMVMVAAVAATVLISTAFEIQQQTEHTGSLAIMEVSTGFKVINVLGDRYNPADDWNKNRNIIEILEVKVGLFAGSSDINISNIIIEINSRNADVTLSYVDTDQTSEYNETATATKFTVQPLRDMSPFNVSTDHSMMTPGDMALFYIDTNATGLRLYSQTKFTIKFIPNYGVTTVSTLTTPAVYGTRCIRIL